MRVAFERSLDVFLDHSDPTDVDRVPLVSETLAGFDGISECRCAPEDAEIRIIIETIAHQKNE